MYRGRHRSCTDDLSYLRSAPDVRLVNDRDGIAIKRGFIARERETVLAAGRAFLVIAKTDTREARANGDVTAGGEPHGRARGRQSRRNTRRNRLGALGKCDIYVESVAKTSHTIRSAVHG